VIAKVLEPVRETADGVRADVEDRLPRRHAPDPRIRERAEHLYECVRLPDRVGIEDDDDVRARIGCSEPDRDRLALAGLGNANDPVAIVGGDGCDLCVTAVDDGDQLVRTVRHDACEDAAEHRFRLAVDGDDHARSQVWDAVRRGAIAARGERLRHPESPDVDEERHEHRRPCALNRIVGVDQEGEHCRASV
jgi:hypothetical protein